jgi:hypothetical protein
MVLARPPPTPTLPPRAGTTCRASTLAQPLRLLPAPNAAPEVPTSPAVSMSYALPRASLADGFNFSAQPAAGLEHWPRRLGRVRCARSWRHATDFDMAASAWHAERTRTAVRACGCAICPGAGVCMHERCYYCVCGVGPSAIPFALGVYPMYAVVCVFSAVGLLWYASSPCAAHAMRHRIDWPFASLALARFPCTVLSVREMRTR